ncbi:uncharacterized protein BX664DRAFT_255317 [Halteromyces radiatus]|uniref:uncharacterized protein n=1 Tax=Halteromyces radiatus TaxID=101107 RepID=UPI002221243F|nr:uncharacterized protein BX664DRAFT_255317 [Halteromyces radiatus]KAI8098913.1 hypothetical protein BX664DRAFT_255317 [Halteromyces radiatus]
MAKSSVKKASKKEEKPAAVVETSSDSESESSDDSSVKSSEENAVDQDSSDDSSSSADSSDDDKEESDVEDSSDESSDSDDSSEEGEEEVEETKNNKRSASEEENEEEEEEEQAPKRAKVEISKEPKPQFGASGLSLFVGQLDWNCTEEQLREFFEDNGKKVQSIRMSLDRNAPSGVKRNRGFGYVDFANKKDMDDALTLNGVEFQGRNIRLDVATPATPRRKDENYSPKTNTVFVANISRDLDEAGLREAFESFGNIVEVRLPIDRATEQIRGIGYIQFETDDQAEKAVKEMNGVSVNGRPIRTDFGGQPDGDRSRFNKERGGFRGGRGGRGGNRGGNRGGPRGGFRGK